MNLKDAIERDAIALPAPFDGAAVDTAALDVLKGKLANADVVCLGEMNHFVHEKSDFRLYLARWLKAQGWKDFAEELGWSDGVRVTRYLKSGDETEFARLPSFNYTGHMRADRDDRPAGILKVPNYPAEAFVSEQKRFYRGLRAMGASQLYGIDIDGVPGGSYEDIRAWLAPFSDRITVDRFLKGLEQKPGESACDEASRLRDLHASHIASDVGDEIARQVQFSLDALADSFAYITLAYSAPNYEALRPAMAFRENVMKRHFANAQSLSGSTRMVLMGHALHLAKSGDPVGGSGVGPGGGQVSSLGHHLAQERGLNLLSIWMLYGAGEDSQPFSDLPNAAAYPPDTLNAALASFGKPLLLPLSDRVFTQPMKVGHMYNAVVTIAPNEQTDAIFFLPRVSPLQS
jgi:erythromycin esterase-like protein